MFHPRQESDRKSSENTIYKQHNKNYSPTPSEKSNNYVWTKLQKLSPRLQRFQYEVREDNYNPQHFERQLPSISKKIPIKNRFNPFYLQVHQKRRQFEALKAQIHRKVELQQLEYRLKLRQKMDILDQKRAYSGRTAYKNDLTLPQLPKMVRKNKVQGLAKEAQNDRTLQQNLFGLNRMGRIKGIDAVYQKQDLQQKKVQQMQGKKAWIDFVLQQKRKDAKILNYNSKQQQDVFSSDSQAV